MRLVLLLSLLFAALAPAQPAPPAAAPASAFQVEAKNPALLRDGSGAQRITLSNHGKTPIPLELTVGAFYDDTSLAKIEAPKITFALDSGGGLPASLAPGASIDVLFDFHGFAGSLSAHAALFSQGTEIAKLRLVAIDSPLDISIDGAGNPDQPLVFSYERSAILNLRNAGKDYVTLHWTFMIGGTVECVEPRPSRTGPPPSTDDKVDCANVVIPPGSLSRIVVKPSRDVFALVDWIKPRTLTGKLLVVPHTQSDVDPSLFNLQPLPVSLTMYRWSPEATQVLFALFVMLLLFIGGALSLLANSVLPDIQKKLAYEKQVGAFADRTSTIGTRVNSYLRVLLRLERKKIEMALNDVRWYSFSTGEKIDAAAAQMNKLDKRLQVVEDLHDLRRRFEVLSASAPPSASDLIDQTLESAAACLRSVDLTDDDVAAANLLLAKARLDMDAVQDGALQTKRVADNFKQLKSRLQAFPTDYYPDLKAALPGIFHVFDQPFDDSAQLVPSMLFAIDHAITAGHIALDYAIVRASIPRAGTAACPHPGDLALQRLLHHECRLLALLGTFSWKALRAANLLVQQMREDIYESDVLAEIQKHRDEQDHIVRITYDTMRVRPYLPIFFSLGFDNPRFANSAALRCLVYRWSFPKELVEDTATVCHYFLGNEPGLPPMTIAAAPLHPDPAAADPPASPVLQSPDKTQLKLRRKFGFTTLVSLEVHGPDAPNECALLNERVQVDPPPKWTTSHNGVELARFLLAFGAALIVLEAGIMDQLKRLDLLPAIVAVVALGFGADSIKNILSQSPKTTPAPTGK